jgi:hypothetical protein
MNCSVVADIRSSRSYKREFVREFSSVTTLDKANHDTGNIRGLNLAAVNHGTAVVAGATNDRTLFAVLSLD